MIGIERSLIEACVQAHAVPMLKHRELESYRTLHNLGYMAPSTSSTSPTSSTSSTSSSIESTQKGLSSIVSINNIRQYTNDKYSTHLLNASKNR